MGGQVTHIPAAATGQHHRYDDVLRPERLGPALTAALGDPAWGAFEAELIVGGKSNLTFRLRAADREVILRRPPAGTVRPSAHDMGRESRVQRALAGTAVPVPRILLDDPAGDILGTPCYVMDAVPGVVIRDDLPAEFAASAVGKQQLTSGLLDALAGIHQVDVAAAGLSDFGRPAGYMARQVRRWISQWDAVKDGEVAEVDRLARWLGGHLPDSGAQTLVHGDFRFDNVVFAAAPLGQVNAVLDWEMSTLGDPLADLGLLLFYWRQPGEEPWQLAPAATRHGGFPSRAQVVERYAARTGGRVPHLSFYQAFAHFKFAVISQDIAARVKSGAMAGQDFGDLADEVRRIATAGLDLTTGDDD
jgi:aminoglycoside phosphotransferase (APT) family kinase protein